MKIQLINIVLAKTSFDTLTKKHYRNFAIALKLAELKKTIDEKTEFYMEQERGLINQYAGRDANGNPKVNDEGRIVFDTQESAKKFSDEIINLKTTEIDIGKRVTIRIPEDLKDDQDSLSPDEIMPLIGLVCFEVDEPCEKPEKDINQ